MDPTMIYHPYDHGYLLSHGTDHMSDLDDYVEYLQNSPGCGFLTERLTQTTRANEQRPRGNGNTRQEIEAIEVYRAMDKASQGLDIGTHGSDDVDDLYNLCNPSLSRDCVTEEVAARSTKPTAMARQSPRIVQGLQGPSFRVVMKNSRSNHAPSGQLSDRGSILRLRSGEESHRHSSNLRADTGSGNLGYDTSQASVLETLEEKAHPSRFSGSWSNPFSGEEFQYDTTASESTSEDQSVMYTNIRDTSVSNRHSSSFDNLHASRSHDLRHGQTSNAEGRSNPSGRRRLPQRTQFASRKSSPKLEVIQMRRSSAGDKRKRTDESCEGFLSTSHVLGLKAGHFAESKKPISQGRTGPSGSQGYAELGSDFVYVEGKRIALPRDLPQPIRLNIQQYLEYHSPPSDTTPPSLSSSLLHFQQNRDYQSTLPSTMSPLLPIRSLLRTKCLVFTSELIPPSFDTNKREEILDVLRVKAPYVPACIMTTTTCSDTLEYYLASKGGHSGNDDARTRRRLRRRLALSKKAWLNDSIPVEIFENICGLLSQSDLRSMRLVNREFERKTSNIQFRSVVVPFGPEIYGMMAQRVADVKGKGKADSRKVEFMDQETTGTRSYDGMDVFRSWGPHVKKFALAFEVTQDQLENPPIKAEYEQIRTWWGPYKWPPHEYARFEFCAGLEKKADEFRCMSSALSNLQGLQELGVCLDSGLGWLAGPDVSDRARIFQQKCKILGSREAELGKQDKECREAWDAVLWPFISVDGNISDYFINRSAFNTEQTITTRDRSGPVKVLVHGCRNQSLLRSPRPLVFGHRNLGRVPVAHTHLDFDFRILDQGSWEPPFVQTSVQPYNLTAAQREWLLETEWAQRAFLSSYCMALTDNSHAFKDVRTLNIAKLSSNHLSALQRKDVWEALPNLDKVILIVAADFRSIHKNADGSVEATDIQPSDAVKPFHSLLQTYIASTKSIKTLEIGYIGGGEHQTGIFGRNRFVLPAPIADYESLFGTDCEGALNLPHVENLSMVNCWVAPPTLRKFVSIMSRNKLRSLTLESVSLTAHAGGASFVESLYKDVSVGSGYPRSERSDILNSLYAQRPPGSDPILGRGTNLWVHQAIRVGSWPHVIDAISPGPTLDLVRYAFRYCEEAPRMRIGGTLEVIDFKSCGYVRLVHQPRLNQSCLPQVNGGLPDCLHNRASELMPVMMHRKEDSFWGQIATDFIEVERIALTTGFPMTLGWDDDDDSKFDNLEDGQPIGGSGRFSGRVLRL